MPFCTLIRKILTVGALLSIIISGCSSPQAGSQSNSKDGKNKTVEEGKETSLAVSSGPLEGASVVVPSGALEIGSNVNINSADVPSDFEGHSGVNSASEPLSVSATSPSGDAINRVDSPMTLQLPVKNLAAGLADVDRTEENLCVFLYSSERDFFVWRRDLLFVNEGIVTFESNLFGVFQLYFCGEKTLSAAKDAKDEKISGSTSQAIVSLVIPKDLTFSSSSACMTLVGGVNYRGSIDAEIDYKIYGATQSNISATEDKTIEIFGVPGSGLNNISDDTELHLLIGFQNSTDKCSFEPSSRSTITDTVNGAVVIGYKKKALDFKTPIEGTFGAGDFSFESQDVSTVNTASGEPYFQADGCLNIATSGDGNGGFTMTRIQIAADGSINSSSNFQAPYVSSGSSENQSRFYLNTTDCHLAEIEQSTTTSKEPTQPYGITFRNANLGADSIQLAPTKFRVATNPVVAAIADRACIQLFNSSVGDVTLWSTEQRAAEQIFQFVSGLTTSFTDDRYYTPVVSGDDFASFIKALTGDESCSSNKDGYSETGKSYSDFSNINVLPAP